MSAAPWYRERAAYLMGKSRAGTSARRRVEILAREARRATRSDVGVGEAVAQDEITPALWRRVMGKEGRGWVAKGALLFGAALVAVAAGVGLVVGRWVYEALVRWVSPRVGRLIWWPWAAVAAVAVLVRWFATDWPRIGIWLGVGRYFPGDWIGVGGIVAWATFQLTVAVGAVAYLIWAWGWAAVPKGAVAPPEKNKDGSFYVPTKKHKLAPEDEGDPVEQPTTEPVAPKREIPVAKLSVDDEDDEDVSLSDHLDADLPTVDDDDEEDGHDDPR